MIEQQPHNALFAYFNIELVPKDFYGGAIEDGASVIHHLGLTSTLDENPAEQFFRVAK